MDITLMLGDCLERMKEIPDNSVDSIVTDPPYGLGFMGKHWDKGVPSAEIWAECLRVLKPGGHLLAFAGTRTQHRMAVNIEDAGFEIRDMIAWVYGSGFPKSLSVSKAIDKAAGAEREIIGHTMGRTSAVHKGRQSVGKADPITAPATEAAKQWDGWGTALKPALEPITVARKPFKGTVAANVLAHGTGAINIDGCRVLTDDNLNGGRYSDNKQGDDGNSYGRGINERSERDYTQPSGRWPANLIHDGSDEVLGLFPESKGQQGAITGSEASSKTANAYGDFSARSPSTPRGDKGSAARFFYCAKASKRDREEGLEGFEKRQANQIASKDGGGGGWSADAAKNPNLPRANTHPTVKPTDLMRYLCRLVTPPGGVVLDPFMGSGSTGKAAMLEGFRFVGIELDQGYFDIAKQRINEAQNRHAQPARQAATDCRTTISTTL